MLWRIQRVGFPGLALLAGSSLICTSLLAGAPPIPPIDLQYREVDYTVANIGVTCTTQSGAFTKEPTISGRVVRGKLSFGAGNDNSLPFLWAKSEGKLYLDLNRNLDFTDDQAPGLTNIFISAAHGNSQHFSGIRYTFRTAERAQKRSMSLDFYSYGAQVHASAGLQFFFEAKVPLQGKEYRLGVVEGGDFKPGWLLIQSWKDQRSFYAGGSQLDAVPFSRRLFLDSAAYALDCVYKVSAEGPQYQLTVTAQQPELGEVKLTGQYVERLVLADNSNHGWLVVLDNPPAGVKLPVGAYHSVQVNLRQGKMTAARQRANNGPGSQQSPLLTVKAQGASIFSAGGPLTNTVSAHQQGRILALAYKLVGADGVEYELINPEGRKAPRFVIYKGAKEIASGNFEFG